MHLNTHTLVIKGWIIVETDNVKGLYEHASEWSELLTWEVTPVLTDEEGADVAAHEKIFIHFLFTVRYIFS